MPGQMAGTSHSPSRSGNGICAVVGCGNIGSALVEELLLFSVFPFYICGRRICLEIRSFNDIGNAARHFPALNKRIASTLPDVTDDCHPLNSISQHRLQP